MRAERTKPAGTTIPGTGGNTTTPIGPVDGFTKLFVRVRVVP